MDLFFLILGVVLVLWGADKLTDGATGLARRFQVNDLVIGLTVVAFGTSLPEFVTSLFAAIKGSSAISLGNVIGSNIFNTLVIVGMTALTRPIWVSKSTLAKDIPFALLSSLVFGVLCLDLWFNATDENYISRGDGLILLFFFVIFMYYTFSIARNKNEGEQVTEASLVQEASMPYWKIGLYIVLGLVGLVLGGNLFVSGASGIAADLGVSEAVIGLTLVAGGTSLPELATSVVAAVKRKDDIAIANVVGSNVFNILFIIPICSFFNPVAYSVKFNYDIMFLVAASAIFWLFTVRCWRRAARSTLKPTTTLCLNSPWRSFPRRGSLSTRSPGTSTPTALRGS